MSNKKLRFIFLLSPIPFLILGIRYHDPFYFLIFGITLAFSVLLVIPNLFSGRFVTMPGIPKEFSQKKPTRSHRLEITKIIKKPNLGKEGFKKRFKTFLILSLIPLIFFNYLALFNLKINSEPTLFLSYVVSQLEALKAIWYLPILISAALLFMVSTTLRSKKLKGWSSPLLINSIVTTGVILTSTFLLSFFTVFLIGIGHVNLVAQKIRADPKGEGIIWGKEAVAGKLRQMDSPPRILGTDHNISKTIIEGKMSATKTGKFYVQKIVANIPDSLISPINVPKETLIMFDNSLVITEIDKDDIQTVSPIIGKLYVKNHLAPRYIKGEPLVEVLGRQDYLKFRDVQINKQLAKLGKLIAQVQSYLNQAYGNINQAKKTIATYEAEINSSISTRDSNDKSCRALSYCGYFGCYDYTDICNQKKAEWDSYIEGLKKDLEEWRLYLPQAQQDAVYYEESKRLLTDYRGLVEKQKESTPQELGLFEPEDSIKIVLESTSSKSLADYYAVLVHEYLHYTSYVSEERSLVPFFEEGLTEYFTRKIIADQLDTPTNIGYPLIHRIIKEMAKKVPEQELEEIYFNKDEKALISLLNGTYGKKFYSDSEFYFAVLSFVSTKEALKIANNIMFKIGGDEIKEDELLSTSSELR